jgi:hypothetical protein
VDLVKLNEKIDLSAKLILVLSQLYRSEKKDGADLTSSWIVVGVDGASNFPPKKRLEFLAKEG